MKTMKSRIIIASAIGALISSALLVADTITAGDWLAPQMPGISAAYLFWGAVGSSVPLGMAICWLVNAIVYGAAAFGVLTVLKLLTPALPKSLAN